MREESSSQGALPSSLRSDQIGRVPLDYADLACLRAAKGAGLIRERFSSLGLVGTDLSDTGWFARADWGGYPRPNRRVGGPWTIERVQRLRELSLLALEDNSGRLAILTTDGKRVVRDNRRTAAQAEGSRAAAPVERQPREKPDSALIAQENQP